MKINLELDEEEMRIVAYAFLAYISSGIATNDDLEVMKEITRRMKHAKELESADMEKPQ